MKGEDVKSLIQSMKCSSPRTYTSSEGQGCTCGFPVVDGGSEFVQVLLKIFLNNEGGEKGFVLADFEK